MKGFKELSNDVLTWNSTARIIPPSEKDQEDIVREELREHFDAVKNNDLVEELDAVGDIFFTNEYMKALYPDNPVCKEADEVMADALSIHGVCVLLKVIQEVINSNFTKFVPRHFLLQDEYDLDAEVKKIEEATGATILAKVVGDYVVFTDENNKVRKPSTYIPPNITKIVSNEYVIPQAS